MAHLFEFMDLPWLPRGLRRTLHEALDCGLSAPFRDYYDWVAQQVAEQIEQKGIKTVVELGAGTAPITKRLAEHLGPGTGVRLIPCDLHPNRAALADLEGRHPRVVAPIYEPVDMESGRQWGADALIVLCSAFHHVPPERRATLLRVLTDSSGHVMVFEPLRNTLFSQIYACGSFIPAVATPVRFAAAPGLARRLLWCWLVPMAPLMLAWDGWVSCLRMWSENQWQEQLAALGDRSARVKVVHTGTSCAISW